MTPAWILDIFAGLMLLVAAVSATRLVVARAWSRRSPDTDIDIDAAHILMGVAMAGMLASGLSTFPNGIWVAVFAVVTAWFGWRVIAETRGPLGFGARLASHHGPHLIHGAAMIYMFAAISPATAAGASHSVMTGMSGAGGMGTLSAPTIGLVFVLLMIAYVVWDLDQISGYSRRGAGRLAEAVVPAGLTRQVALAAAGTTPVAASGTPAPDPAPAPAPGPTGDDPAPADSRPASAPVTEALLDARVATACRIAMGVTMALMLVLMI